MESGNETSLTIDEMQKPRSLQDTANVNVPSARRPKRRVGLGLLTVFFALTTMALGVYIVCFNPGDKIRFEEAEAAFYAGDSNRQKIFMTSACQLAICIY